MDETLKVRTDGDKDEDIDDYFPGFIWTVCDFTLDLKKDGEPATPDEYLERILTLKEGKLCKM